MIVLAIIGGAWLAIAVPIAVILGKSAAQAEHAERPVVPDTVPVEWTRQ